MINNQFQRSRLILGDMGLEQLQQARVLVVGCGAVGSFATEALARAGVGRLALLDGDVVEESNINRQLCALHSTIGQHKTQVLKNRIFDICPETEVAVYPVFLNQENQDILGQIQPDFVIDAIDQIEGKVTLITYLQQHHIPFISSMGAALRKEFKPIQVATFNQTKGCPLAARLRKILRQAGVELSFPCIFSDEHPSKGQEKGRQMGSLVTITGMFGLIAANEAIRFLTREVPSIQQAICADK